MFDGQVGGRGRVARKSLLPDKLTVSRTVLSKRKGEGARNKANVIMVFKIRRLFAHFPSLVSFLFFEIFGSDDIPHVVQFRGMAC